MPFLIKDDKLLKKYDKIWKKVKNSIDKDFNSDPVYNEKCLKAKIKSKINTNFHNNKIPNEGAHCVCLSVILINFIFRTGNNYYPQVFVEDVNMLLWKKRCQSILLTT